MLLPPGRERSAPPQRVSARRRLLAAVAIATVLGGGAAGAAAATGCLRELAAREVARRIPAARIEGAVTVDRTLRIVAGPVVLLARDGAPPLASARRVAARVRPLPLLRGRVEIASISLEGVRVDVGRGGSRLAELRRSLEGRGGVGGVDRGGSTAPPISVTDATVAVGAADGPVVDVGPFDGEISLARQGSVAVVHAALRGRSGASADLELRLGGDAQARLRARDLAVDDLPARWRERIPLAVVGGRAEVTAEIPRVGRSGTAHLDVTVRELSVRAARLASGPVGPATLRLSGAVAWDVDGGRFALDDGRLSAGADDRAAVAVTAEIATHPEATIAFTARAERLDWRAAMAALPPALSPPLEAPSVSGELDAWISASGPLGHPEAWTVDGDVDPTSLATDAAAVGPMPLDRSFRWLAPLPDGGTRPILVGPENPAYVPLAELPAHVVRAVMASEDAGFFGHHGFDLREVQEALARSDGRRLRGASTITQQLAKNLFLTPERTLARKVREALATVALEASLGKRRLLEIYLNIAEWGPGVHGIGEAAHHWFGKDARDLTPKEAAFLASVIPNPVRYEMYRRRGALTERWEERVRDLLIKLRDADVLTEDQFYEAWTAPLGFPPG